MHPCSLKICYTLKAQQLGTKSTQTVQQLIAPQGIFLKVTARAGQKLGDLMRYPPLSMHRGDLQVLELNFAS